MTGAHPRVLRGFETESAATPPGPGKGRRERT